MKGGVCYKITLGPEFGTIHGFPNAEGVVSTAYCSEHMWNTHIDFLKLISLSLKTKKMNFTFAAYNVGLMKGLPVKPKLKKKLITQMQMQMLMITWMECK